MSQLRARRLRLPVSMRLPVILGGLLGLRGLMLLRRRSRRPWPSRDEFARMDDATFERFMVSSGFDAKIKASLAEDEEDAGPIASKEGVPA